MSATNRSDVRRDHDHYVTPAWAVQRFLEAYDLPRDAVLMDPCAANGELLSVVKQLRPDVDTYGVELRRDCMAPLAEVSKSVIGDFLELSKEIPDKSLDVILTNFPFSLAEEFLEASRWIAKVTITLQRINWIRGNGRHKLMGAAKPGLFVLPERPSFTGYGTDATEYAWFVFDDPKVSGTWQMLAETPEEVRAEWNKQARVLHPVEEDAA